MRASIFQLYNKKHTRKCKKPPIVSYPSNISLKTITNLKLISKKDYTFSFSNILLNAKHPIMNAIMFQLYNKKHTRKCKKPPIVSYPSNLSLKTITNLKLISKKDYTFSFSNILLNAKHPIMNAIMFNLKTKNIPAPSTMRSHIHYRKKS